ncbi:hypothetical protein [Mechercharimyces sp. CAU 1602]|uniref:hypothetical protein n=1 Tax=Mechercharimyces sp. CAU 1602 TaxID=2973933 RepID=UPI00216303AA|nr:hypothetical protein [Mechercharimyces sp. CAU 1602]MCS1352793.1 hypothetical protein [Mechercharimyces sp. CAU 1602]
MRLMWKEVNPYGGLAFLCFSLCDLAGVFGFRATDPNPLATTEEQQEVRDRYQREPDFL